MKKVAVYLRVSTASQSVDSQKLAIQKYLEAHSIKVYELYVDEGISGAKKSRPQLDNLIHDVAAGKISTVICYSLSRISRSASHLLTVLEHLQEHKVHFLSISEHIDLNTSTGKLLVTVLGAVSELERAVIKERVIAGLANARAKGVKLGKPKKPVNRELLMNLAGQNMPYKKMSKLLGISPSTICRELKSISLTTEPLVMKI